jgi:hypothetical protein
MRSAATICEKRDQSGRRIGEDYTIGINTKSKIKNAFKTSSHSGGIEHRYKKHHSMPAGVCIRLAMAETNPFERQALILLI